MFLKQLAELSAVTGDEFAVRDFIKEQLKNLDIEYEIDLIGNVIVHNQGVIQEKLAFFTHMDEVGFMISGIDPAGFLKIKAVGEVDERSIASKSVVVGDKRINGVIGSKAIHLKKRSEFGKALSIKEYYIDIGATSKEDAERHVSVGEYASFKSGYKEFGLDQIKVKAADSRVSIAVLLELLSLKIDRDFYVVFTVLEKLEAFGLDGFSSIGSKTSYRRVAPDLAITLGGVPCADMPEMKSTDIVAKLGDGPVLSSMDKETVYDSQTLKRVREIAGQKNIKIQNNMKLDLRGFNHVHGSNSVMKRTVSFGLPVRYIDTPVSTVKKTDVQSLLNLVKACVEEDIL